LKKKVALVVFSVAYVVFFAYQLYDMGMKYDRLLEQHKTTLCLLMTASKTISELEKEVKQLIGREFTIEVYEATAYAPLDPNAKEGICYSGDPRITASGKPTTPDVTVAADPSLPFGTWLYIQDIGWRRVDDRGGAIKGKRIDICVKTQKEALRFGRRKVIVVIPKQDISSLRLAKAVK